MWNLELLIKLLELALNNENYEEILDNLIGHNKITINNPLSLQNIVDIVEQLNDIECYIVDRGDILLNDYIRENKIITDMPFFDFVKEVLRNGLVVRFDGYIDSKISYLKRKTSYFYTSIIY